MLSITDRNAFLKIVAQAIADAHIRCERETERNRWIRAIAKAVAHIEQYGEFMTYDEAEDQLVIWSQESDEVYSADAVCQCSAYLDGVRYRGCAYPCFHRAAARLMRNYFGRKENKFPLFPTVGSTDLTQG